MSGTPGRGGRKRIPTRLKVLAGTWRPDRDPPKADAGAALDDAKRRTKIPRPPKILDAVGKAAWTRVVQHLAAQGLLLPGWEDAVLVYAASYSEWKEAQQVLAKDGRLIPGRGGLVKHPAVALANQAARRLRDFQLDWLTPTASARLRVGRGID